jgi:DNA-binding PadR family transcriptional regulator
MLALLAADGLSVVPLYRLAQARPGAVIAVLDRMEDRDWVDRERRWTSPETGRHVYTLNGKGRANVTILLGLPAEAARLTLEANDA